MDTRLPRTPLTPTVDDRRYVERVLRDLAGIVSLTEEGDYPRQQALSWLAFWLSDIWLVMREAGWTREALLELVSEPLEDPEPVET